MPDRIVVVPTDTSGGYFDLQGRRVFLSRAELSSDGTTLLAHESSHVCLGILTQGASNEEAFRFADEGYAEVVSHQIDGTLDEYKREEALPVAALQLRSGNVSFTKVQAWSNYFGDWKRVGGPRERAPHAYPMKASFVFFLVDRYGEVRREALFRSFGRTRSLDASSREVFG